MIARADRELRADMLLRARWIAQAVNIELIQALKGTDEDLDSPYYQRLKEQLALVKSATPLCQSVYILGRRSNGTIFFFLNSESPHSKNYISPGLVCKKDSEVINKVFSTQTEAVEGPVHDPWGNWVSPLVPILDAETVIGTGESLAVLGMNVDVHTWNQILFRAALPTGLLTLALTALLLSSSALLARRSRLVEITPHSMHYLEPALAASLGLILTFFIAWLVHQQESYDRTKAFLQLAASRTSPIAEAFHDLLPVKLEILAHFYEATPSVTPEKFSRFTECLTKNTAGQAWEWIPAIPAADKIRFEEEAHAAGLKGFGIWEKDEWMKPAPAREREMYYPVFLATPLPGNARALGYDLGSETVRRTALEEAARTGLPTVTDPVTLVQESGTQVGLLVYHPVFWNEKSKSLRGFALAVLRVETLLKGIGADQSSYMELSFMSKNGASTPLTTARNGALNLLISATRPVFAFGKVFAVTAYPGPEFLRLHPVRGAWLVILTGLLLTTALVVVITVVLHRQEKLEQVVFERTEALRENKQELQANYEKLSHIEASRDSIVHMVIHDMRTPLFVITGYVDLLKAEASTKLDAKECRWLEDVSGSAETLMEMASQLLDITQMESGNMPLKKEECALADVVASAIEPLRILCGNRHLKFETLDLPPLLCDANIIRRIIGNLVGNAIKFTQESGKVKVCIEKTDSATVRVSVSDNGFGIPWESQKSVFDKFSQMNSNKKNLGFGLGLAFCRLAVEAHGGQIGLESEPGKGSTFWFELPQS